MNAFSAELKSMSLRQVFQVDLNIPDYQRFYSWKTSHVTDLLKDVFSRTTPYLLGTIILHQTEDGQFDIVDGQQRLVTLTILLKELEAPDDRLVLLKAPFSKGALAAIRNAQQAIRAFLRGREAQKQEFLSRLCPAGDDERFLTFDVLTLHGDNALDRAYTFFDSVNSKGKALSDFDLLKAHHLMFIPTEQESLAQEHNDEWMKRDDEHGRLFTVSLRRLRLWSRREERDRRGERPDFNEFSSKVDTSGSTAEHAFTRYMQPAVFRSWRREGTRIVLTMDSPQLSGEDMVPTEITQSIEGGDPFFIYAKRYHGLYEQLFTPPREEVPASSSFHFVRTLTEHVTNGYLRDALRSTLLLYVDKFGDERLREAAICLERIISSKRWEARSVRIEGVLTHVREKDVVPVLLDATNSRHAIAELLVICQTCQNPNRDNPRNAERNYFDSLRHFYCAAGAMPGVESPAMHIIDTIYKAGEDHE